jgi:hypothetical protein
MKSTTLAIALLWIAFTQVCLSGEAAGADYEPGTPATWLFDTGSSSPSPLNAAGLASKSGWRVVPEDGLAHQFRGDAVFLNDRVIVVLRRRGAGAEVYCQTAAAPEMRAALLPLAASGDEPGVLVNATVLENNLGAVMLSVTFRTPGGDTCELRYRLTAGQVIVEAQPGKGVDRLLVRCPARYVVVPDFFGDDMVFGSEDLSRPRLRLPAENFCLGLSDQGSGEVMCVWQSSRQQAVAVRSGPGLRQEGQADEERETPGTAAFAGWEIQADKDKSIWVACFDGTGLWHQQVLATKDALGAAALDWKPPFAAKWRADLLRVDGAATSWFFHDPADASKDGPVASETALAGCPCCFEGGRAIVRLAPELQATGERSSLLVYALDRSRETPLATFCPIDVLRNTLGVGPCQYILQTEGLATETNPTPENVMTWVEKQFARNRQKKSADEIRELLGQMVAHVGHAQARIEQYGSFGREVCNLCGEKAPVLRSIGESIERDAAAFSNKTPPPAKLASQLAEQVLVLIGRKNSMSECEKLGAEIRQIGASEDRALARCRMAARWLRQSAAMLAEDDSSQAVLAGEVQARAERMLGTK